MSGSESDRGTLRRTFREELLEPLDPDALIFTTFGFDEAFFEDNILGWIGAETRRLQTGGERREAELWADEHGVSVFFEPTVHTQASKRLTFPTYPVTPPDGVFHPKLIVASGVDESGERRVRLLVTSANLSRPGWGQNREVGVVVDVENRATAGPLAKLLRWLFDRAEGVERPSGDGGLPASYGEVLDRLEELQEVEPDGEDPRLVATIPGRDTPSLMSILADTEGPLTVVSPYLQRNIAPFLRDDDNLGDRRVRVVPAVSGTEVEMTEEGIEQICENDNFELRRLDGDGDGDDRFDHLKVYEWEDGVAVGSHNATEAALGRGDGGGAQNVEVSVVLPGRGAGLSTQEADTDNLDPKEPHEIEAPGDGAGMDFTTTVLVDWEASTVTVRCHPNDGLEGYSIGWPGMREDRRPMSLDEATSRDEWDFEEIGGADKLGANKTFVVYEEDDKDDKSVYRGSVVERCWRTHRRDERETSLEDCLAPWQPSVDFRKYESSSTVSRWTQSDREASVRQVLGGPEGDLFDNYFFLYQATRVMLERFEEVTGEDSPAAADRVMDMLHKRPGSLTNIVEILEDARGVDADGDGSDGPDTLFEFLLVEELATVLAELDKQLSAMPEEVRGQLDQLRDKLEGLRRDPDDVADGLNDEVGEFLLNELRKTDGGWSNVEP